MLEIMHPYALRVTPMAGDILTAPPHLWDCLFHFLSGVTVCSPLPFPQGKGAEQHCYILRSSRGPLAPPLGDACANAVWKPCGTGSPPVGKFPHDLALLKLLPHRRHQLPGKAPTCSRDPPPNRKCSPGHWKQLQWSTLLVFGCRSIVGLTDFGTEISMNPVSRC